MVSSSQEHAGTDGVMGFTIDSASSGFDVAYAGCIAAIRGVWGEAESRADSDPA